METWRAFFQGAAGVDLWTVCERALTIAYTDSPDDFPTKRDRLARKFFSPEKFDLHVCALGGPQLTESKGSSGLGDLARGELRSVEECRTTADHAYDEAEALTEEIEEEILSKKDVLHIKETLLDSSQSERETFNSLRRLELMQLSFDALKDTEIGKVVNGLRKHSSKRVATLARRLVREWKELVEACCKSAVDVAAAATAELPENTALEWQVVEEEEHGLPSPPMDEAALLAAPTAPADMFQLWDFMDEVTSADPDGARYSRKPSSQREPDAHPSSRKLELTPMVEERQETSKASTRVHLEKGSAERKASNHVLQRTEARSEQTMETSKPSVNFSLFDEKILAAKRNLRENYEREQHAKKQRTIQVLDIHDLPKGGPGRPKKFPLMHGKPSFPIRPRVMSCT